MKRCAVALGFAAAALVLAAPLAGAARLRVKTAHLGEVSARLTWSPLRAMKGRSTRLTITRRGAVLVATPIRPACQYCAVIPRVLRVQDLDRDHEPEVYVTLSVGGAHDRVYSVFYTYDPARRRYRALSHFWDEIRPKVTDLNRDGATEFIARDTRLAYAFTDFADSYFPVQVWTFRGGVLSDTTRGYSSLTRDDSASLWHRYRRRRRSREFDARGLLAAYQAEKYLVGEQNDGWRRLQLAWQRGDLRPPFAAPGPRDRSYLRSLRHFLRETGYAR